LRITFVLSALCAATALHAQELPDRWIPSEQTDNFDGKKTLGATAPSRSAGYFPHRRPAETNLTASLRVLCAKGQTVVYVEIPNKLIAGDRVLVSYKFDDRKPVENQRWSASDDSTATGFWGGDKAVSFAKDIENSKTLTIRTNHNVFGQMEARFETSNAKKYFDPLRAACRWK
jgi:hypothetical protein